MIEIVPAREKDSQNLFTIEIMSKFASYECDTELSDIECLERFIAQYVSDNATVRYPSLSYSDGFKPTLDILFGNATGELTSTEFFALYRSIDTMCDNYFDDTLKRVRALTGVTVE